MNERDQKRETSDEVPSGFAAIRADFAHYRKVHATQSALAVLFTARSFWALAVYRFGRWVNARPRPLHRLFKAAFALAYQVVMRLTKVSLGPTAELGAEIWLASRETIIVAPGTKIGRGAKLHGANTLGIGGRPGARGVPVLREGVELLRGAVVVGPVELPAQTVIGENAVVTRSLPHAGRWTGVPAQPADLAPKGALNLHVAPLEGVFDLPREERSEVRPEPFLAAFREDLHRHFVYHPGLGLLGKLKIAATVDGIWAIAVYRFGRALRGRRLARTLLWPVFRAVQWVVRQLTAISLDVESAIGPGFYIGHFGPIRVGPRVRIGRDSSIGQLCTVTAGQGSDGFVGAPVLGERVYLGVGCRIVGPVKVGSGAAIGANAVVLSDVPADAVMVGAPAKVASLKGSADFIFLGAAKQPAASSTAEALARAAEGAPAPRAALEPRRNPSADPLRPDEPSGPRPTTH